MKYIKLVISVSDQYQEVLIAELLEKEFDAFEQQEGKLITYIIKEHFNDVNREQIEHLLAAFPTQSCIESEEIVEDKNWNEEWEQTIQARQIGPFFVKPTWVVENAPKDSILLEIDPKMAFGTGYHETTRLMLTLLPEVITAGDVVLDVGTGTGILAIASVKLGAKKSFALDIDDWSILNAKENVLINQVEQQVEVRQGSIDVLPEETTVDTILANINRNTILNLLPEFVKKINPGGNLVLSGLFSSDEEAILQQKELKNFELVKSISDNKWIALSLSRTI